MSSSVCWLESSLGSRLVTVCLHNSYEPCHNWSYPLSFHNRYMPSSQQDMCPKKTRSSAQGNFRAKSLAGNVANSSLSSFSSMGGVWGWGVQGWRDSGGGGGLGRGREGEGQGTCHPPCYILHYHMVLHPKGTSHNNKTSHAQFPHGWSPCGNCFGQFWHWAVPTGQQCSSADHIFYPPETFNFNSITLKTNKPQHSVRLREGYLHISGNILVILTIRFFMPPGNVTNIFVANLALGDLLVLSVSLPFKVFFSTFHCESLCMPVVNLKIKQIVGTECFNATFHSPVSHTHLFSF